jgi:peptidyl-prolyl cis-trans isomerase D
MAVLQKIRQRSLLLIAVIGFSLLAFIVQDLYNKGGFGNSKYIGSVNGKDISFEVGLVRALFRSPLQKPQFP